MDQTLSCELRNNAQVSGQETCYASMRCEHKDVWGIFLYQFLEFDIATSKQSLKTKCKRIINGTIAVDLRNVVFL